MFCVEKNLEEIKNKTKIAEHGTSGNPAAYQLDLGKRRQGCASAIR